MAGEKILAVMQGIALSALPATEKTDIVSGEIISTSPLTVTVENGLRIDRSFLIIPPLVTLELENENAIGQVNVVRRPFEIGETLLLLRVASGQRYYVLSRGNLL